MTPEAPFQPLPMSIRPESHGASCAQNTPSAAGGGSSTVARGGWRQDFSPQTCAVRAQAGEKRAPRQLHPPLHVLITIHGDTRLPAFPPLSVVCFSHGVIMECRQHRHLLLVTPFQCHKLPQSPAMLAPFAILFFCSFGVCFLFKRAVPAVSDLF